MPVRKKPPLARRRKARQLILQAVYQWLLTDSELTDISKQFHEQNQGKIDWEFFDEVLPGVLKSVEALDKHLHPLLDRKLEALDPIEKALLYLGTYELANRIDVPYRVVINECVELAKMFGATESHKYINGVLDKLAPELRAAEYGRRP
ncbi:MAG: transcription antitermination factor NusB [Gammaproteobacteria bacterium]|jgi:N utilization substance protein B|nr:transcription antitermination factor NusB [Gammaproteobacteria bacterium]|tara:strand:- start:98 stop:544 length:447 start_codon:yes stop_codon:yes gene_type:complete